MREGDLGVKIPQKRSLLADQPMPSLAKKKYKKKCCKKYLKGKQCKRCPRLAGLFLHLEKKMQKN